MDQEHAQVRGCKCACLQIQVLANLLQSPASQCPFGAKALPRHLRRQACTLHVQPHTYAITSSSQRHFDVHLYRRTRSHRSYARLCRPNVKLSPTSQAQVCRISFQAVHDTLCAAHACDTLA